MTEPRGTARSGAWFLAVGAGAALLHLAVFTALLGRIPPEWANVLAFCCAFVVSFMGHRSLSFSHTQTSRKQSLWRFLITALAGFALNELLLIAGIRWLGLPPVLALIVAQIAAAGQTFLLARLWAFR